MSITLTVNGGSYEVDVDPATFLLYVLMEDLELNGPKFGCGLAQCGACTVLVDGRPIRSCVTPVSTVEAPREITTIEGLGTQENPHPIQTAFIEEQAAQCAFCISGIMLYGKVFMDANPNASEEEIAQALNGLLCRCYAHGRMVRALRRYGQGVRP
jgi:nicotinate dehydrogenase subunit A